MTNRDRRGKVPWMSTNSAGAHVLLVDDDVELSAMLRQYLENEGFKVTVDFNGKQAAAAAISGDYDAVILDVMLPTITGIELLRRIRQESTIPIIMLTAKGDQVDRVIGLELGADDYLPKPYYAPELVARLKAVLRRRNGARVGADDEAEIALSELRVNAPARRVTWRGEPVQLTTTEFNSATGSQPGTNSHAMSWADSGRVTTEALTCTPTTYDRSCCTPRTEA
jgi:two-component system OmpR family response regulator